MKILCLKTLALVLLLSIASYSVANADDRFHVPREDLLTEEQRPFLLSGHPVPRDSGAWKESYGRSILRYDTAEDCIDDKEGDPGIIDLSHVDWRSIRGSNSFDVCAFRIVTSLKSKADVMNWLQSQRFEVTARTSDGDYVTEINERDVRALFGSWTVDQYREYRPSFLSFLGLELVQGVLLSIFFTERGEVFAVTFSTRVK